MKKISERGGQKAAGRRSSCPIACALDLVGDKWTLLIVRDMHYLGKTRFEEFLASPEKISTNILASRLKTLEANGLVTKSPYGNHSQRMSYELTASGKSLAGLLRRFAQWGLENIPETATPEFKSATK
ncbi:MAG TPA: helix-turn-helix domain-containing protein [Pyrinomonadaceae bacterium]|jgi:DNA-binding HxlR family transcriptional regulator